MAMTVRPDGQCKRCASVTPDVTDDITSALQSDTTFREAQQRPGRLCLAEASMLVMLRAAQTNTTDLRRMSTVPYFLLSCAG